MQTRGDNQPVKMNIILLGNFLYPEGMAATKRKQQFIDYFKQSGAEVKVLVLYQGSNKKRPKVECEGWHKGTYFKIIGNNMVKDIRLLYQFPIFIFKACRLLSKWKINGARNVILSFGFDGFVIIPFLWARIKGYKIYFDIVEDFSLYPINTFRQVIYFYSARIINKIFLNSLISGISVISKHLERKYKRGFKGNIVMVPISAEVSHTSKTRFNHPITFMYAGSFSSKDGVELLLSAFDMVYTKYLDIRLILSGSADSKRIQELLAGINCPVVEFVGMLPDEMYYNFLNNADVLLMTRVNSGFSNAGFPYKLGEYLATGNVVISTKISDVEVYLQDKINALLIEPESKDELVKAMEYCIENQNTCIEIGRSGQEKCILHFNPELNSKTLFDLMAND